MVRNKKLKNFIYFTILVFGILISQIFNALANPNSSRQQEIQEKIESTTSQEIKSAIANPSGVCEQEYIRILNLITKEFYDELKETVSKPTYDSVLIEDFKQSYLKARYLIKLHQSNTQSSLDSLYQDLEAGEAELEQIQSKVSRDSNCINITQSYLDEISHVYKSTLSKSVQAKKGAVILEKYDQLNKQFETLLNSTDQSVRQFNKINDNLVCYTSQCI